MKNFTTYIQSYKEQLEKGEIQHAYRGLIKYLMNVRTFFARKYSDSFYVGHFHQGYMDITYFTLTPLSMKNKKCKVGIGFNHEKMQFGIWLGAQSRKDQKNIYEEFFKESNRSKYTVLPETTKSFAIVEYTLVSNPDFDNLVSLTEVIERETLMFIKDIEEVLNSFNS